AAAAEEALDLVHDAAGAAASTAGAGGVPGGFGGGDAAEAFDAAFEHLEELFVLGVVEPVAVVGAGVDFEGVGAVVEGGHLAAADGALEAGGALGVLDHASAGVFVGAPCLEVFEFGGVEPEALAGGAVVDLDAVFALEY